MNSSNLANNPAWNALSPAKKEILQNLITQTKNLTLNQSLPHLLHAQAKLKEKKLSFTPKETELLLQIFTSDLSPKEKATFEALRRFTQK